MSKVKSLIKQVECLVDDWKSEKITEQELFEQAFPIMFELAKLNDEKIKKLEMNTQEMEGVIDELQCLDIAQMAALSFIKEKGLESEFETYLESEVTEVFEDIKSQEVH